MTPLMERLLRRIELTGPIPFHEYWTICLFDADHGYYTTQSPIGASGDFTTAPEISQMFGEMLAAWWLETVLRNKLYPAHLVEIGPGRGTLMADMLRTLEKLDPALPETLHVHLVEVSPRLTGLQKAKLAGCGFQVQWHNSAETLPPAPLGIVANELFDAITVRPFVKRSSKWFEQAVTNNGGNGLRFVSMPGGTIPEWLPDNHEDQPEGTVFEFAPARDALMGELAGRMKNHGGFGLFIDYGHLKSGFGDTVQAVKNHGFANPLENPGEADLTSHVDFAALACSAIRSGLIVPPALEQGGFLVRTGIRERAARLANSRPDQLDRIETACDRLIDNDKMGSLFKVMAVRAPGMHLPVFDTDS